MKKVIYLFCLVLGNILVSANSQTISTQTWPQIYNQNSYQTPNTYQIPNNYQNQNNLNIPVLLQQQPTQIPIVQQNTVPTILQTPSNNNQLYSQQYMLQNQMATPTPNNQYTNPIANQLSQMYMNKILSNPTIQGFLDQNGNFLYNTGLEYSQRMNNIPNYVQNPGNTPTVVNNYFLLPPELINNEMEHIKPTRRSAELKRGREGLKKETVNRRYQDHSDVRRKPNHDAEHGHPDVKRKYIRKPDCPIHSKKENYRKSEPIIDEAEHRHSTEERERNFKRIRPHGRNHDRERDRNIPPDHPFQNQRIHPERHNGDMTRRHHEMQRPHQNEMKRPNIIIKIKERPKQSSSENQSPKVNSLENSAEVTNQHHVSKKARHSRDDEIIEDFKVKFPAIPEEVVRKLLSYLRRQIHKQQLGHPTTHYHDDNFPLRYDQLLPHSFFYDLYDRNNHRRRSNGRPNKKQQRTKGHSNSNIETTTNIDSLISTIPTTTERSFVINNSNENDISSDINRTYDDQVATTPKHSFETTTINNFPELGTEDISHGIINDYFPDFSQDKTYFENGEVFNVRNLRDNRYHYTTDRNYEPKHNNDKHKKFDATAKHLEDEIEKVLSKSFDKKIETTSSKYEIETDIHYRTPPLLESPDFRTKQVIRHKPNDKNLSYKSSSYSNAKTPSKIDGKDHRVVNNKKLKPENIQTMYAHSKVVKYGKVNDDEENVTPVVTYYLPDNMQYEDDGKTVIVAKRIPADHFW